MTARLRYQVDNLNTDRESGAVTVDNIRAEDAAGNLRIAGDGNLIVSAVDETKLTHLPIFDLDVPHRLVPSRTPGHAHLYVDVEVPADKLRAVIVAMVDAGLMGHGNLAQFDVRGMQCARDPQPPAVEPPTSPPAVEPVVDLMAALEASVAAAKANR